MFANFGFQKVKESEKEQKVQSVFTDVATKYNIMNDLMSLGMHRLWKKKLLSNFNYIPETRLLDLAGGTGDVAKQFIDKGGKQAVVLDLNQEMINSGKNTIADSGLSRYNKSIAWVLGNAEKIPFEDSSFDHCTISFGLRNVTHIDNVLEESFRILKPGGKFLCLEFSQVQNQNFKNIYKAYSFHIIPLIGKIVANSQSSYEYLVQSIENFLTAKELKQKMEKSGYYNVKFIRYLNGIVALHTGYKI